MLRYLLLAKPEAARESFEEFAYEHVCSHDRRVETVKRNFMVRNKATCRGILKEYWDRTEEQQRKSLHQHILEWWEPRAPQPGHVPIAPVPREVPGHNCQQRSMQCTATTAEPYQEDEMYYAYHVSRIWGELVRPNVANACKSSRWSSFGVEELRVAGLARAVQTTSYIHQCSSSYCLASGPNCRFFHTWPLQMQQQYDENTERVALQRRLPADDRWVVGHDLEMAMFNTGQIHVGGFELQYVLGRGGMGTVWVAKQSQPIKRKVAIKLIKAGMDSQQVLARFEAERQALAMMEHPNIARVVDAGMTEQGRPYFAMEYVKGVPLTEYCDQAKLSVKERLELFLPICTAVQHAHQKGIIHRDLKPSNILVCLYDGKPVPKVIDFGLAKAMHHSLTEQSLYTAHGMMVGTPLYMSPEQAEHNNLDIDTRTDVYALGVILYELLTGTTPLEKAQMKEAAYDEFLRLIKEVEPPKPSTRLNGSASLPSVAAQRSIDPSHLTRSIAGDLDWVVMKALEKERCRRYETANGLVEDIRRHLSDEPVSASPPSARYRMRKFIKRNRAGVIAASAIAVALLLGVVGTTSGMLWALSEKRAAVAAREAESEAKQEAIAAAKAERLAKLDAQAETKKAEVAAKKEKTAYAQAQKRLAQIEKVNEILGSIFKNLNPLAGISHLG